MLRISFINSEHCCSIKVVTARGYTIFCKIELHKLNRVSLCDKYLTKTTIQTTSLHWRNDQNKTMLELERENGIEATKSSNNKTNNKDVGEPPEGSRRTKVPLGCAISMSIHSGPMGKDSHLAVKLRKRFYWRENFVIVRTRID